MKITDAVKNLQSALSQVKEVSSDKPLAKNEIQAEISGNGMFSIEFGSDISSGLRKSAVQWLFDKGFALLDDSGRSQTFKKKETEEEAKKRLAKNELEASTPTPHLVKRWALTN